METLSSNTAMTLGVWGNTQPQSACGGSACRRGWGAFWGEVFGGVGSRSPEVQTPKEAFRSISWKFHGKAAGIKMMELWGCSSGGFCWFLILYVLVGF